MRTRAGKLIADLNDKIGAVATASLPIGDRSTVDENQTVYRLFPYELNDTPIFTQNIFDASSPRIVSDLSYSPTKANVMYRDENNTVRVLVGTSFVFRVAAQQPNILNVENGVPLIFQPSENLTYTWFKDGELVSDYLLQTDLSTRVDRIAVSDSQLIFNYASPRMAGQYTCVVSNDIGDSTSEIVDLEIRNPNDPEDTFFKQNVIQNGFAQDSTNGWTVAIGDATTGKFVNKQTDLELKRPNGGLFGHSVGEVYPHPSNIKFNGIKNYKISSLLNKDAQYFTRDTIDHSVNGGTRQAVMYQDVDLSEITDYISGRVYGCNGIRAYFGSIIGNALTKFIPTVDLLPPNLRYKPELYYTGAPRISYENFVLTGYGVCDEKVTITIQEYEGATPLPSVVYKNGSSQVVDCVQLTDTLSTLRNQFNSFNEPVLPPFTNTITTVEGIPYTPVPLTNSYPDNAARYLNIYKTLYRNKVENYYSYGQYADYQDAIIRVLNPSTNKVRISIKFEYYNDWAQYNEIMPSVISDGILQLKTWTKPMLKLVPIQYSLDVWAIINQSNYIEFAEKPLSVILETIKPHTMVTGLGLILEPLTATSVGAADFRNQIATIVPKEQEVRPATTSPLAKSPTPFASVAQNVTGLSQVLSFNPNTSFWFIRRYEDVDTTDWAGNIQSAFDTSMQDKDDEYHNGDYTIENLTTGELWYNNFYRREQVKYGADWETFSAYATKTFAGLQTIRITVNAQGTTSGENGEQDKQRPSVFPWLYLKLTNTKNILTPDSTIVDVTAYPNLYDLSYTAKPLSTFSPTRTKVADLAYAVFARKIVVDIPSNCLRYCVAGLRNNNNNPDTSGTVYSKFEFTGPNGELQYVRYDG